MDKTAVLNIVLQFKDLLEMKSIKVKKNILYGSYPTGTFTDTSDIDLIVISDDFVHKDFWERVSICSETIYELSQPLEVVALTPEEGESQASPLVYYAASGEIVYAA